MSVNNIVHYNTLILFFITGIINFIIRYVAVPLIYLEAGLLCDPKSLYSTLTDGYLLTFVMAFMYILMPFFARITTYLLTYAKVNIWLLKGVEVIKYIRFYY